MNIKIAFLLGIWVRILNLFIPVKKNNWVFGSSAGLAYKEGTKYLIEYALSHNPEVKCTFITSSKDVAKRLKEKNIPCALNYSLKGILCILRADKVFYTHGGNDIYFSYRKKNRKFYYVVHGMPMKVALGNLPEAVEKLWAGKKGSLKNIILRIMLYFTVGNNFRDVSFVSACSDFLARLMETEFPKNVEVKILGMPRNDILFLPNRIKEEYWYPDLVGKFVITYMPTHRKYGFGDPTPTPFKNRPDIQKWLIQNNIVLLVKNHPNMIRRMKDFYSSPCIKDITRDEIDAQVLLFHTNILITDFSSVWMDYLLLNRPIIFYLYDDFEKDDVGCYYDIRQNPAGSFCSNENELFELIQKIIKGRTNQFYPPKEIISKYHKYIDGKSCQRYFKELMSEE